MRTVRAAGIVALYGALSACVLEAADIKLKDGRILKGNLAEVTGVAEQPNPAAAVPSQIVLIDSGLTRTYIAQRQIEPPIQLERRSRLDRMSSMSSTIRTGS